MGNLWEVVEGTGVSGLFFYFIEGIVGVWVVMSVLFGAEKYFIMRVGGYSIGGYGEMFILLLEFCF